MNDNEKMTFNLKVGDSVGMICKVLLFSGDEEWRLLEDKITRIIESKKGRRYYTKSKFLPLDADDVDLNTEMQCELTGCILTKEVFGLNEITRLKAEEWVILANEHKYEELGILRK